MTNVVNVYKDRYDVYIGRKGRGQDGFYGNPVSLEKCISREDCIEQYEVYFKKRIQEDAEFAQRIEQLRGQRLGCFCIKKQGLLCDSLCHGMVIVRYLEGLSFEEQIKIYNQPDNDTGTIIFN